MTSDIELLRPFLAPIGAYMDDDGVTEIMVNPGDPPGVFYERNGILHEASDVRITAGDVFTAAGIIANLAAKDVGENEPILEVRLPDGSRATAVLPPVSVGGPSLVIRKFSRRMRSFEDLCASGSIPRNIAIRLLGYVEAGQTVLISGSTGSGKTTLLGALAGLIDPTHRVVVIEDTTELQIGLRNLASYQARREERNWKGEISMRAVTMRDLVRTALRLRPDRIILGEVRGQEGSDLIRALSTGHGGSFATIHAQDAADALLQLSVLAAQDETGTGWRTTRMRIASCVGAVAHVARGADGSRRVVELIELARPGGYDFQSDEFRFIRIEGPSDCQSEAAA